MTPRNSFPRTHHELLNSYYAQYDKAIESGQFQSFTLTFGFLGSLLVITYLLIPHRHSPWLKRARYLVWTVNVCFTAYTIKNMRARNMAPAFGLGLTMAWSVVWSFAILVAKDVQEEFHRIEHVERVQGKEDGPREQHSSVEMISKGNEQKEQASANTEPRIDQQLSQNNQPSTTEYAWQTYPLFSLLERLDWVLDLYTNFRGMIWNWRIPTIPPPPKPIQVSLQRNSNNSIKHQTPTKNRSPFRLPTSRHEALFSNLKMVVSGYIVLDALKTLANHDPYFWGIVPITSPLPPYFPSLLTSSPFLARAYRLFISLFLIQFSLQTLFAFAPLVYVFLFPLLTKPFRKLGNDSKLPLRARNEPWSHPPTFGPLSQSIVDRGLGGWWGLWWHQTFRAGFSFPSEWLLSGLHISPKSNLGRTIQVTMAFGLSAILHASGSHTQPGPSNGFSFSGPILFFLLQGLGIIVEGAVSPFLQKNVRPSALRWVRFVYTWVFLYNTSPLLVNDFAAGGIWLYEPVPVSVFRSPLFNLGAEGDRTWCWGGEWVRWVNGDRWWLSGLSI
ncbi:hypothetical protein GQ43DRAFT_447425 [Delitschia confertaspora ATCC 74209]|uniref:Wax synthase domain-containing protein n=1 Tax=Delitschia confertaspora ATCC 74209 TaxID=1513339 RepID=A0A9P4JU90_9PLEO|nr:hypothetical protein GQ43DRAFT_447425 [Delitschia confertaspora ATCC 74209]